MQKLFRRLSFSAAVAAGAAASANLHAATIDFEGDALTGLYFAGDSFVQSGFRMTAGFDFGTVDSAAALGAAAPSGNSTQFYFNSNDGELIVDRDDGVLFSLGGFSAAFVPLSPPSGQTTVIAAVGTYGDGSSYGAAFLFPAAANGTYPFGAYANPAFFTEFTGLKTLEFFACSYDGVNVCSAATQNNGQFAIDDITLTAAVPEPASVALMALGLAGLGLHARRRAR